MKKQKSEPKKSYWMYVVFGILSILLAALFFPLWANTEVPWASWGLNIVNAIIGVCLLVYVGYFLLPKVMKGGSGAIQILVIAEFVVLVLIGVGCFLSQFKIISISEACAILGLCLVARGVVEIFRAYYHQADSKVEYPLWWLVVAIAMVILGTYCIAKPLFENTTILWLFVAILLICGIYFIVYGLRCKPQKKKETKKAESKKTETAKEEPPRAESAKTEAPKPAPKPNEKA